MPDSGIKPETRTLDTFIQASVEQLLSKGAEGDHGDGLLFLGNWHDAMPRLIFKDPVLQPVDTRVWGVIKIASQDGRPTAFPTYAEIARTANVGSEATVARAIAILRITRWLSLCRRVRDPRGRVRGNVYALHDEPLPLVDAIYLDQRYLAFLNQSVSHAHPRVRKVALAMLASIGEDVRHEKPPEADALSRRLSAGRSLEGLPGRYFGFTARQLQKLKSDRNRLQFLGSDRLQNMKSDCSSSCIYKKTTTTTVETSNRTESRAHEPSDPLVFPKAFSDNERQLARLCLDGIDATLCQDVLDELTGRLSDAKRRDEPIANPIGYLAKLVKAANNGTFVLTSLGLNARQSRTNAARLEQLKAASEQRAQAELDALLARTTAPHGRPHASRRTESGKSSHQKRGESRRPLPPGRKGSS